MKIASIILTPLAFVVLSSLAGAAVFTIDDGDSGYADSGDFTTQAIAPPYNGDWKYQNNAAGNDTATYTFSSLPSGKYVVATSTFTQANLSTDVTWNVSDGGGTYSLNQQVKTNHFDIDSGGNLGTTFARLASGNVYTPAVVTDGTLTVSLSDNDAARFLIADAVRVESIRSDVQKMYIIGNGDLGYSESSGTWATWAGDRDDHGADLRFSTGPGSITVAFTGIDAGIYRISTAFTGGGNRPTNVSLSYTTAGGSGSVSYSQVPGAAADDVFENVNWQDHFTNVAVTGNSLTLELSNTAGALIADGFRLELIPEPSAALLCGLAGCLLLRRRRF